MIYRQEVFTNAAGTAIFALTPIDGSGPTLYHANVVFTVQHGEQQLQVQARVEIQADSIQDAFEKYPEALEDGRKKALQAVQEQMNKAAGIQPSGLVLPGAVSPHLNGELRRPRLAQ